MNKFKEWAKEFFNPKGVMSKRFVKSPPILYVIFGLIISLAPMLIEHDLMEYSALSTIARMIIFTVVALGLNLLLGFSGLISLGTAGFIGYGAFGVIFFSNTFGLNFIGATIVTIIIAAIFGALIGLFSLKVEGIYLAIATLFVGEILLEMFRQFSWFTGGYSGTRFHYPQFNLFVGTFEIDRNLTYVLLVIVLIITMIIIYNIVNSKTGRALMAMSRSQHAAQAMGISLIKYRLFAFITATVFATLAGVLYASFIKHVTPDGWDLNLSLMLIAIVVVGGFKSIFGTVLGTFIIYGLPEFWLKELFQSFSGFSYIFQGVLIIVVIMFYPNGAIYIGHDLKKLYYRIRRKPAKRGELNE